MNFFKQYPFVRIVIPLIAGIALRYQVPVPQQGLLVLLLFVSVTFLAIFPIRFGYRWQYLKGIAFNLWVLAVGLFITGNVLKDSQPSLISGNQVWFAGRFLEIPVEKEKVYKAEIQVEAQQIGSGWKNQNVKLIAYFEKDSLIGKVLAGQPFMFGTKVAEPAQATNPFGFDYQKYLRLKQVETTVFLKSGDWYLAGSQSKGLAALALNLRKRLISVFESVGIQGDELAVVSALTLGYKDKMEARIRDAYTAAGVVHVLAVSGAHVAIVFAALSLLFKVIPGVSKKSRLKYILLIGGLWGYALLTGLSPSVCRATTMFSFVLIGNLFRKRANIYNSMAASACLLLLINPLWVFDIGFQLSYVAVVGIVFFYPKIYGWLYVKNKILDYVWSLTAISLAAQLVTAPISLYYFHVFPTYFWLSNIVVVFGATVLIYLAVLLLLVVKIPMLFAVTGLFVKQLLIVINGFVLWVTGLPFSQIGNIPMNGFSMILLLLFMGTITAWLLQKHYSYLFTSLFFLLVLLSVQRFLTVQQEDKTMVCVYQIPKQTAIQFVHGKYSWWFTSQDAGEGQMKKLVADADLYWGTSENEYFRLDSSQLKVEQGPFYFESGFWQLGNYKGVILKNQTGLLIPQKDSLSFDLAIVTGKPSFKREDVPKNLWFKQWVADGSVPIWKLTDWEGSAEEPVHLTKTEGAFIKFLP